MARVDRSRRYIAWLQAAGWELKLRKPPRFTGPVDIKIEIGRPDQRRRGLDNFATKAVLDLLTAAGVIPDDPVVTSLAARGTRPCRLASCG